VAGTEQATNARSALRSVASFSLFAPAGVSAYAILGAFWSKVLVGAGGQNCGYAARDPWQGIAILAGLGSVALVFSGGIVLFSMRLRSEAWQMVLSGLLLALSVLLLLVVVAGAGYLHCPG
jgi:hypothetical protein